jgi:adenine-specific DNA methylase
MDLAEGRKPEVEPFSLQDAPALIERLWPVQKISAEAQKERKAVAGQTLTGLGSYWKGRKPLILVKACILGALLPATDDSKADLAIFEQLMGIDDEAFTRRGLWPQPAEVVERLQLVKRRELDVLEACFAIRKSNKAAAEITLKGMTEAEKLESFASAATEGRLSWSEDADPVVKNEIALQTIASIPYAGRLERAKRPEEIAEDRLFTPIWPTVNAHLGTSAWSMAELVEQLGIMRYGQRPKVADTFCGGGSIPFEAARLGCDVQASDLNPIAAMLTWGALHIVGGGQKVREIAQDQRDITVKVQAELTKLGIEEDDYGNRAKVFLYCLEAICPQTGWRVPLAPSWVLSAKRGVIARLVPNYKLKYFDIEISTDVSEAELAAAAVGTVQAKHMVYELDGEIYRTSIRSLRGDYRQPDGTTANYLRRWQLHDATPQPGDLLQERLYAIQWMTKESLGQRRPETFFAAVMEADLRRERQVEAIVREQLADWQQQGLVSDMAIEPGRETEGPIRTNGWGYWHQMLPPRSILTAALLAKHAKSIGAPFFLCRYLDNNSKACRWAVSQAGGDGGAKSTFDNQALKTIFNWAHRAFSVTPWQIPIDGERIHSQEMQVSCCPAIDSANLPSLVITDPPYADAVRYEEITEFFIAWLRKQPPSTFKDWAWDSRRALAIRGDGENFRREMVAAYHKMAQAMPDHGLQIIMFTHQDAKIWSDLVQIVWAAGLRVTGAWYIATETNSELKKGGYVQGTVILVLRKRQSDEDGFKHEIVQEVKAEVARQIESMVGLNQQLKGHGRVENLFEDADLQMAGYAAALRVLTGYRYIDGTDMAKEAVRPRKNNEKTMVAEIIEFAVQVANEQLVPEGLPRPVWERLTHEERFFLKMADIEATGAKKLDNYQNFAKAFRAGDYASLMASVTPNDARLVRSIDLRQRMVGSEGFAASKTRAVLYAMWEIRKELEGDEVMGHLRNLLEGYYAARDDLRAIAEYLALKRQPVDEEEASAARILAGLIRNERLG